MTHYLRFNEYTVVDAEAYKDDLHVIVCLYNFIDLYRDTEKSKRDELVRDFSDLQELRGEWFECDMCKTPPDEFVADRLKYVAQKWNLSYVTD